MLLKNLLMFSAYYLSFSVLVLFSTFFLGLLYTGRKFLLSWSFCITTYTIFSLIR